MARRQTKPVDRDESDVALEGNAVGLETLDDETAHSPAENAGSRGYESDSAEESTDEIARKAYERYQRRGGAHGQDQEDWFEAEREVRGSRSRNE